MEYSSHIYINKEGIDSDSGGLGIWFRSQAIQSAQIGKRVVIFSFKRQKLNEFEQVSIDFVEPQRFFRASLGLLRVDLIRRAFGKFGWDSEDLVDRIFGLSASFYLEKNFSKEKSLTRVTVPLYGGLGSFISSRFNVEIALVSSTRDAIDELDIPKHRLKRHYQKVISREDCSLSKHIRRVSVSKSIHLRYGLPFDTQICRIDAPKVYDPFDSEEMVGTKISKIGFFGREDMVLFIGRCEERKGFHYLISIWKLLSAEFPTLKLILVGDSIQIQQLAVLDLPNVVCLGFVSDKSKSELLSQAKVVLIPSRYESFGIVTIEAMAFGTPIVVSNVGGLKGIADLSSAIEACEVGDAKAFARKAALLVSDKEGWEKYSEYLRKEFFKHYKLDRQGSNCGKTPI